MMWFPTSGSLEFLALGKSERNECTAVYHSNSAILLAFELS